MTSQFTSDSKQLQELLEQVLSQSIEYIKHIKERGTSTKHTLSLDGNLNENGLGAIEALKEFNQRLEPLIVASSGPRYWGYVTGGSTPASIAGDWLSTIYDQNVKSPKGFGDVSALIEQETINLFKALLSLPDDFSGGFVSGATMSNFTCLAVARQWLGKQHGENYAADGLTRIVPVLSATPHSSAVKSLSMLGIGSKNTIVVKTASGNREAIDIIDLENKIQLLADEPFILISSAGTVDTADFDDFKQINHLKEKHRFWWHIDAAFGGFAVCSESHKHLLAGWENADSITVDCHKWLNVPYDSAVFLVKECHQPLQIETFQNSNAPYLGKPGDNFSYANLLPENSRRLRALPVWLSLKAYGKSGICSLINRNIFLAQTFGTHIEQSDHFTLLAPVRLNIVCFTLTGEINQEKVSLFLERLNETQYVFMTPTTYKGKKGIRAAFVNWLTTEDDVDAVMSVMKKIMESLS